MNRDYEMILNTLPSLLDGIDYDVTLLSNASALFNDYMDEINWVGFYLFKDGVLKLIEHINKKHTNVGQMQTCIAWYCLRFFMKLYVVLIGFCIEIL